MKHIVKRFYDKPWKHALLALICFVLAYVLASWAIDTGRLTAYFFSILFGIFGIRQVIRSITMELRLRTK
jgi:uncharacterized membrane protein HdeD (DUF308 family)